jgi:hypothetical protein
LNIGITRAAITDMMKRMASDAMVGTLRQAIQNMLYRVLTPAKFAAVENIS